MKQRLISSVVELDALEATIAASATSAVARLSRTVGVSDSLGALADLRFAQVGCDPLNLERPLNFIEQLNQSFTYLASIEAARWLFANYPENAPFLLNLGTSPGFDIISADGAVAGEVFAATHPDSNRKLRRDIARLRTSAAPRRFVFYLSPGVAKETSDDVKVIRLRHRTMNGDRLLSNRGDG